MLKDSKRLRKAVGMALACMMVLQPGGALCARAQTADPAQNSLAKRQASSTVTTYTVVTSSRVISGKYTYSLGIGEPTDYFGTILDSTKDKLKDVFFSTYPVMSERFNSSVSKEITVYITPNLDNNESGVVAYASDGAVYISMQHLLDNPNGVDVLTHELFHIVQDGYPDYNSSVTITALTEGMADYARAKYGLYNKANGWSLTAYQAGQSYLDGYKVTGSFLTWIEDNTNSSVLVKLNSALHDGTYTDSFWESNVGESLDDLWNRYADSDTGDMETDSETSAVKVIKGTEGVTENESCANLFDDNVTTKWCVTDFDGAYVIWMTEEPVSVTGYAITTANDNSLYPGRNPKTWTLYGCDSNTAPAADYSGWTVIDTVEKDNVLQDVNYMAYNYTVSKSADEYQYYMLKIDSTKGSSCMQISEFSLLTAADSNADT